MNADQMKATLMAVLAVLYIRGATGEPWIYSPKPSSARYSLFLSLRLNVKASLSSTTMPSSAVVLILGAGPRIGAAVAERFSSNGYQVALASRSGSGTKNDKGFLSLKADFSQPDTIPSLFKAVKAEFHSPPNIIVYNAGSLTNPPEKEDPLSIAAEDVQKDFVVNTVTPYVAAHEAAKA